MDVRDQALDNYRGLTMLYIVCFVHTVYWLGYVHEPVASLMLVEMPVIFFISGAALSLRQRRRSIWANIANRARRVLLPYYIYAAVSLVLLATLSLLLPARFSIADYTAKDLAKIALTLDIPQLPYVWHTWFVLPYMILMATFPLQQKILEKSGGGGKLIALNISLFCVSSAIDCCPDLVKETLCYNVFVLLGYLYYRKARVGFIALAFLVALLVLGGLVALGLHFVPMQANKFPPNLVFLFYGLCALCLLSLLFGYMRLPQSWLVQLWNRLGYTIYLYQNLVIAAVAVVRDLCFPPALPHGLCFALCVLLALIISTLLSFLTSPFERMVMVWLDNVAKRCGRRLYM